MKIKNAVGEACSFYNFIVHCLGRCCFKKIKHLHYFSNFCSRFHARSPPTPFKTQYFNTGAQSDPTIMNGVESCLLAKDLVLSHHLWSDYVHLIGEFGGHCSFYALLRMQQALPTSPDTLSLFDEGSQLWKNNKHLLHF